MASWTKRKTTSNAFVRLVRQAPLSTDSLANDYLGEEGMLAQVANANIGDDHKGFFHADAALKAGGKNNTMTQFQPV